METSVYFDALADRFGTAIGKPVVVAMLRKIQADTTRVRIIDADTFYTTIRSVESLQERFPLAEEAQQGSRLLSRNSSIFLHACRTVV